MDEWSGYYERLFNFREIRYFDLEGQVTGIKSRAMTSPCGKIRIPINEEGQEKAGQIQEYLDRYHGEGVQHIAMGSTDLYRTVDSLTRGRRQAARRRPPRTTKASTSGCPGHGEPLAELKRRNILIDGDAGTRAAADLLREPVRAGVLRVHPAQGQRGIRRRQLQGAVRIDGAGPDPARRGEGAECACAMRSGPITAGPAGPTRQQLPAKCQAAGATEDSVALVNVGWAMASAGQYDKGTALMEQGIQKGGITRLEEARLHLAIAYLAAGQKAKAIAAFKSVQGGDATADLARLWLIHAQRSSG